MINLILIFPLFACLILFLAKKEILNNFFLISYAILHIIVSICVCFNIDFLPGWKNSLFFEVTELNKIFLILLSIVYLGVAIYNREYMKNSEKKAKHLRHYTYMMLIFVLSMTGSILSTNLAQAWIFIEATTLSSTYLIYFYKTKHSIEAAWKYVFICSIGIAMAFVGIILLSASMGNLESLFYKDLYANANNFNPFWLKMAFVFILFGIGTKMGLSPLHFWLPDAHAQSPSPVSALLSAALLNCAFLIIIKVYKIMAIAQCIDYANILLITMGFLSLFTAAVFVYHINNYKRMLAYSSIENMGILAICLAFGSIGLLAALIHLIGHSLIKSSFFLTSGNILKIYNTKKIKSIEGIIHTDKLTLWLWVISFIGISAFPPCILFVSEFLIVKTMIQNGNYILCALFLILLTIILYGIGHSIIGMSFGKNTQIVNKPKLGLSMYIPQIIFLSVAFLLGIYMPNFVSNILYNAVEIGL